MSVLLLVLLAIGPSSRIGIIGALDVELAMIQHNMAIAQIDTLADRVFYSGTVNGITCVCVKAGVGKVNAALTAEVLINAYDVDAVIFTGVAGGINPRLEIGDIVISERVLHHDYGQIMPDGLYPYDTVGFSADTILMKLAQSAAANVMFEPVPQTLSEGAERLPRVVIGRIATGDQFISSEVKRQWIETTFRADCVEMEGAAVAQVCVINKIPFVVIRSLSDLANEKADVDFESFVQYAAQNSSLLVREILQLLRK